MNIGSIDPWRRALLGLGTAGLALFGGLCALSFLAPLTVERLAREAIRIEVQRRVEARVDDLSDTRLAGLARKALEKTAADAAASEDALRRQIPEQVANAVANMLNADCECRQRLVKWARDAEQERLGSLRQMDARLTDWIERAYAHTRDQLLRELRIFTSVNAVCFALLGMLCLCKRPTTAQLGLVAITLLSAGLTVGGVYLFQQDWLHTIVFGTYVGWAYGAYLAGVTGLFSDIAFNRGFVTSHLLGAITFPSC